MIENSLTLIAPRKKKLFQIKQMTSGSLYFWLFICGHYFSSTKFDSFYLFVQVFVCLFALVVCSNASLLSLLGGGGGGGGGGNNGGGQAPKIVKIYHIGGGGGGGHGGKK